MRRFSPRAMSNYEGKSPRRIDRSGGVKLQRKPRNTSHRCIGSFAEIVRCGRRMVCGGLIECISQSLEGFQNPITNYRIEPETI